MNKKRRTKIIATLGPASRSEKTILAMAKAGVDIFRLNFSYGDYFEHNQLLKRIRKTANDTKLPLKVLIDLKGNKLRLTKNIKGNVEIFEGQDILIEKSNSYFKKDFLSLSLNYDVPFEKVKKGSLVFIDDAKVGIKVEKVLRNVIKAKVMFGEEIGDRKGVHFPGLTINFKKLTDDDKEDILWGIKNKVDYIAQSFVQNQNDIKRIKKFLKDNDASDIKVIAKIENKTAIDNLKAIFEVSDGVMAARGDLGVCLSIAKVPLIQKKIASLGNFYNKHTIVATQLMDSMVERNFPTRAEAVDVSNAIFDGNEMLLLSNETAVGRHPVKVVEELIKIIGETEKAIKSGKF